MQKTEENSIDEMQFCQSVSRLRDCVWLTVFNKTDRTYLFL